MAASVTAKLSDIPNAENSVLKENNSDTSADDIDFGFIEN